MNIQTVSLILGAIGTIGTIAGGVIAFVNSRVRISVEVIAWHKAKEFLYIYAVITNNSRLPISISSISAILDDVEVPCSLYPFVVTYRKLPGNEGGREDRTCSLFALSFKFRASKRDSRLSLLPNDSTNRSTSFHASVSFSSYQS